METGGVAAPVAVGHGAVAQADLLHRYLRRQIRAHQLPKGQGIGGAALRGVEGQDAADGFGLFPGQQPVYQLRHRRPEGRFLVYAADLRLDPEIAHRPGGLHQRAAQKGAPGLVGGKYHVPGHILGVKLSYPGDHYPPYAAGKQVRIPPQTGEHTVVGLVAPTPVQSHGKQEPAASQRVQIFFRVGKNAPRRKQGCKHLLQSGAAFIFRQKNGQRHFYPFFHTSYQKSLAEFASADAKN